MWLTLIKNSLWYIGLDFKSRNVGLWGFLFILLCDGTGWLQDIVDESLSWLNIFLWGTLVLIYRINDGTMYLRDGFQ